MINDNLKVAVRNLDSLLSKLKSTSTPNEELLDRLKTILDGCSDIYYNTGDQSPLTDEQFDQVYKYYIQYRSYSSGIEIRPTKKAVNVSNMTPELVGTTLKVNDIAGFKEWLTDRLSEYSKMDKSNNVNLLASLKYDGNSIVTYFDYRGNLKLAITRGRDGLGADVTTYFKDRILNIPSELLNQFPSENSILCIKNEAIITYEDFDRLNKKLIDRFANPRSAVSGLLSSLDKVKYADLISLVPLSMMFLTKKSNGTVEKSYISKGEKDYASRVTQVKLIDQLISMNKDHIDDKHITSVYYTDFMYFYIRENTIDGLVSELKSFYDMINSDIRSTLEFMIDGIVIEFIDDDYRAAYGREKDKNRFDVALKFPYQEKKSHILDIEWYVSNTGRLTPVAVFEDTIFNGAVCNHVSLANYKRFEELGLSKGDEVIIQYRNDVLCYLTPSATETYHKENKFTPPTTCPSCGCKLTLNSSKTFLSCTNLNCPSNYIGRVVNWFDRLGVKGIKEQTVANLADNDVLNEDSSIDAIIAMYKLDKHEILELDGWKDKSADNLLAAVNSKKDVFDYEFFAAIGIPDVNKETCKAIFKMYTLADLTMDFVYVDSNKSTFDFDRNVAYDKLLKVPGISDITANKILDFYKNHNSEMTRLGLFLDDIKSYKQSLLAKQKSSNGKSYNFVFSGFRNNDLKEQLEEAGHKVTVSGVSSKTDYLVVKDPSKITSKVKKAQELGKNILSLENLQSELEKFI